MTTWFAAFQSVAFKDTSSSLTIEEDNDLYCSSGEGIFAVKLVDTEASKRCCLEPKSYTLVVAAVDIKLIDNESTLYTWPYRYIRRYGYREGKFTFEAGRKCESGEGLFCLEHSNQQGIFRCISSRMKSMKKLLNGETSPNIECNDAQFHAALSMEAGSRTPLPPSPNSSVNLMDLELSTNSRKLANASPLGHEAFVKPPPPSPAVKPAKPPRKYIFNSLMEKKNLVLDLDSKYKKLMPVNSPEFEKKEDDHSYDFVNVSSNVEKDKDEEESPYEPMIIAPVTPVTSTTSPIIYNVFSDKSAPNYDKLQHFGSTHKLNLNSGYKTPNVSVSSQDAGVLSHGSTESGTSWDNYDVVEDMSAARLANDSHHGYGMIRKKPAYGNDSGPKHKVYNNSEYAIVSKPKRV